LNKFKTITWIGLVFSFLTIAQGQTTLTWTGGDGNWATAANWDSGTVPGVNDNVIFGDGFYTVTINSDTEIGTVTFSAASGKQILNIEGKKLTLNGEMSLNNLGKLDLQSGTEMGGSGFITNNGYMSSITTTFNLSVTNNDTLLLQGINSFNNSLTTTENSFIEIRSYYTAELALTSDFTNNGLIKFNSTRQYYSSKLSLSSGTFTNSATGEILFTGVYNHTHEIAAPFNNDGALNLEQSLKLSMTGASHINSGTINIQHITSGFNTLGKTFSVYLTDAGTSFTNNGTITADSSAIFYINNGVYNESSTLNMDEDAKLQTYQTDMKVGYAFTNNALIDIDDGSLEINGDFTNNSQLEFSNVTVLGSAALTNNDNIDAITSTFNIAVTNNDSLELQGINSFNNPFTTSENSFIEIRSYYTAELALASDFTNNGLIKFNSTRQYYSSKLSLSSGTFTNSATGEILFTGVYNHTHEIAAPFNNDGALNLEQSLKLSMTGASHINSGTINIQHITSGFNTLGKTFSVYLTDAGTSFTNNGTITADSSAIFYINNGVYNESSTLNMDEDAKLQTYQTDMKVGYAFTNNALIDIDDGSLEINGDFTNNSQLEFSNVTVLGSAALTNNDNIDAITSTFNIAVTNNDSLELQGINSFNNPFTTSENSFIEIRSYYTAELALASDFTNNGLIKFNSTRQYYSSRLSLSSGTFTNSATGEILFAGVYNHTHEIAAPVQNNGLFTLNKSAKIINVNDSHINDGRIFLDGGTFIVTGQSFENKTNAEIGGNGTLDVQNISFVNNGNLNAGNAPGMFYIKNDLPMAISSILGFELAGPIQGNFYNSFIVNNLAKLNGSITIELTDGYVPNTGEEFILAEFASKENSFLVKNGLDINTWKEFELIYEETQLKLITKDKAGQASPYAHKDYATVLAGKEIQIDVLYNDTDPENETLNLISVGPARHGIVSIQDGKARYISEEGYGGEDQFIYTVENVSGSRTSGLVNIQTNPSAPIMPVLAAPADSSVAIGFDAKLYWYNTADVDSYEVEISTSILFNTGDEIIYKGVVDTFVTLNLFEENTFHWRVRSENAAGHSKWTASWSFTSDSTLTALEDRRIQPHKYRLYQNYPNPFNPSTTIKYDLAKSGAVTLTLFNILGKRVAELVNENKTAGEYSYNLNLSGYSSGVYYYRIKAEGYSEVRRLLLLK
jgi:Bacterial Ig domain/Secretion system C-terminal sorting domain